MTSLNFQLRISLLFFVRLRQNLVREIWVVLVTLSSYKISCDLEGHLDPWVKCKVNAYSFFIVWFVDSYLRKFLIKSLQIFNCGCWQKELPVCSGITSSIYLNWNISVIYCRFEIKLILVKAEWRWLLFRKRTFLRHFWSRIHDVIKLSTADISLIFRQIASQFGQRNLGGPYDFEVICDLESHLDIWVQWKG